ncbi:MAG: hypothetical protein QW372_01280 [Nitrososphaerales archaeon]
MQEQQKFCSKCNKTYPITLKFCLVCGSPLIEQIAPIKSESFKSLKDELSPTIIKIKHEEVKVPSWDSFERVVNNLDNYGKLINEIEVGINNLENRFINLSDSLSKVQESLLEAIELQKDNYQKLSNEFSVINTMINNYMNDLLMSVSSIWRFVRDLESSLTHRFNNLEEKISSLIRFIEALKNEKSLINKEELKNENK